MATTYPPETNQFTDPAAGAADNAIKATQRVANDSLDHLAQTVQSLRDQTAPMLNRVGEVIDARKQQLQDKAQQVSESTVGYIRHEPVKAILIAAATGAAVRALVNFFSRRGR